MAPIESDSRLLHTTSNGDRVLASNDDVTVIFSGPRDTLSTSWLNGGYQKDLLGVFNEHLHFKDDDSVRLEGGSPEAHLRSRSRELFGNDATSGLLTAALMENAVLVTEAYEDLEVTAVVTGGIDVNGGRVGDPASYLERNGDFTLRTGTINTLLLVSASLPEYAMVRSLITVTEAKTSILQELRAPSRYSNGIATGSGTDMVAIVSDPNSDLKLTDAGKHSKLGELIGRTVREATAEALRRQTGLGMVQQLNALVRLGRYREIANTLIGNKWSKDPGIVALTEAILHTMDQGEWGMLDEATIDLTCSRLLDDICSIIGINYHQTDDVLTTLIGILSQN